MMGVKKVFYREGGGVLVWGGRALWLHLLGRYGGRPTVADVSIELFFFIRIHAKEKNTDKESMWNFDCV